MTAAPIHAVVDGIPAALPELSVELPDGEVGYFQRSRTDCLKAALCTAVQIPYDNLPEIPNLRALQAWADAEGFTVRFASLQFRGWDLFGSGDIAALVLGSNDAMRFLKVTLDYGATTLEPRDGAVAWNMPHDVLEAAA